MDEGDEEIDDDAVLTQVRQQARKVYIQTLIVSVALTAVFILL